MPEVVRQAFEVVVQVNGVQNDWHAKQVLLSLKGRDDNLAEVANAKAVYDKGILRAKLIVPMAKYVKWAYTMRRDIRIWNYGKVISFKALGPIPKWLKLTKRDHPDKVGRGYTPEEVAEILRKQGYNP